MKAIILANGQPPHKSVIRFLIKAGYTTFICADGGANTAYKLGLIPDFIIGDFDSINDKTFSFFNGKSKIIQIQRQNDTDVEKCLKFAIKKKIKEVVLLGGTGDRLDHSFCNLGIVLKYSDRIKIKAIHQKSILSVCSGTVSLDTIPKEIISVYGFDEKTKILSSGLKYSLRNVALPFGKKESTSNVALSKKVELEIKNGKVFVIREFNLLRKYGLV
jgi:thiamine pyrophosphokinase